MFWPSKPNSSPSESPEFSSTTELSSPTSAATEATSPNNESPKLRAIHEKIDRSIAPLPETMSCQVTFDMAAKCAGIGGKFRDNYRYGSVRSCSHLWSDFWFCMRTRGHPDNVKRSEFRERYREKEVELLSGPNSEDIWEERAEPVERFCHLDPDLTDVFKRPKLKE